MSGSGSSGSAGGGARGSAAGSIEGWVQAFGDFAAVAQVGDGREPTYGPHANMSWTAHGYGTTWPAFEKASPAALAANSAALAKATVARKANNKVPSQQAPPAPVAQQQQRRWDRDGTRPVETLAQTYQRSRVAGLKREQQEAAQARDAKGRDGALPKAMHRPPTPPLPASVTAG